MKCVKCGKRLGRNEKFCPSCGYYVGETNDNSWQIGADLLEEERINTEDSIQPDEAVMKPIEDVMAEAPKKEETPEERVIEDMREEAIDEPEEPLIQEVEEKPVEEKKETKKERKEREKKEKKEKKAKKKKKDNKKEEEPKELPKEEPEEERPIDIKKQILEAEEEVIIPEADDQFHKIELTPEEAQKINPFPIVEEKEPEEKEIVFDGEFDDKELDTPGSISVKDSSGTKKNQYSYENEDLLEAYIGEDYKIIKKMPINIWAFLLNWMYLLYRKLYVSGIVGLFISWVVIVFLRKYLLIYLGLTMIILGFAFNKYYIFIAKKKVERIINNSEEDDKFVLANTCAQKGGVNVLYALIIYLIFLIIVFFSIVSISINRNHNTKFWEENSQNKATCTLIIKTAYKNVEDSNIGNATDAVCKVTKKKDKEYEIYIKTEKEGKVYYSYYATENDYVMYKNNTVALNDLQVKKANGQLSEEEQKLLIELKAIELNYQEIYNKSKEEDELIRKKKNKEEKLNYILSQEEIIQ